MERSETKVSKIVWRPIPGHEGYYWINNFGKVKNSNNREIARVDCGNGVLKVKLQSQGQIDERYVSTLMAEIFPEYVEEY